MSDGAHQGIGAVRALETVLGGKPAPLEGDTREQVRARIMARPSPLEGDGPKTYDEAADCLAKAFVLVVEKNPKALGEDLYNAANVWWPGLGNWLHGPTGFMVGWAVNCVRWLYEQPPVPNPAIITVD